LVFLLSYSGVGGFRVVPRSRPAGEGGGGGGGGGGVGGGRGGGGVRVSSHSCESSPFTDEWFGAMVCHVAG